MKPGSMLHAPALLVVDYDGTKYEDNQCSHYGEV